MLQAAFLCASCVQPFTLSEYPREDCEVPGELTAKCLDTALVMCPTPGARICRPKECHPAVQDEIVGDVLGSSHRQPNPI